MPQRNNHKPKQKLFTRNYNSYRPTPITLGLTIIIWTLGAGIFLLNLRDWRISGTNYLNWLAEIFLILNVLIYCLWGIPLNLSKNLIQCERYRVYGMILMALVTLQVGLVYASYQEPIGIKIFYLTSILISVILMKKFPKNVMEKMKIARSRGWLISRLDEKQWIWNPLFIDLDGPIIEKRKLTNFKILDKFHYLMPGIASLVSSIFGSIQTAHIVGLIFIYLSIIFISEVGRLSGIVQQLRIWEIEAGKQLKYPCAKDIS